MTENMNHTDQTQEMKEQSEANNQEENVSNTENTNPKEGKSTESDPTETSKEDSLLTELQKKYDTLNDKYLRMYSEFENFRRRTAKEKLESLRSGGATIVKDLLPVVDDFDRAMVSNELVDDPEALKEGFKLIHAKLYRILEQQGLKPMDSMEKPFDTEYHDAITNIPAPTDDLKGKVVDVAEKGYFFNDTVLRHAKVIVGQ